MNRQRRNSLRDLRTDLHNIALRISYVMAAEQEACENIPETMLERIEAGEAALEAMQAAIDAIDAAKDALTEAIE